MNAQIHAGATERAGNPPNPWHSQVLARRGVAGYRQYRIPALAVTTRGTLLAAYDGRPNLDDLPNPIDLLLRRSTDNGVTWGPQEVVRTGTGLDGYGDPSLLVDAQTGRIFLFHAAGTHAGFFEAVEGLSPPDQVQHCDVAFSDDDGVTWQHRRLTAQLKRPGITGIFAAAGAGIQIHTGPYTGRLVQQFVVLDRGEILAASAYSDDHGDTWTLGEPVGPGTNENKVACLADGRLLLHSRATPFRLAAFSTDGGHSYSVPVPQRALPDPSDNGSLARFDGLPAITALARPDTDSWLIATHNHDTALRRNTVLQLSRDGGTTWSHRVTLCPGSSAYSTAARLPDGRIGVLYERQGYQEIVFATLDPQVLLDAPAVQEQHDGGSTAADSLAFDVVLRSITPGRAHQWKSIGDHVVLTPAAADWNPAVWKEVGQGYSAQAPQILSNRESQDANYGPVVPGYKAGDLLAFTGRVANRGAEALSGVAVDLVPPAGSRRTVATADVLPPGGEMTFTATYEVTGADIEAGTVVLGFTAGPRTGDPAQVDAAGAPVGGRATFSFDVASGDVQVST